MTRSNGSPCRSSSSTAVIAISADRPISRTPSDRMRWRHARTSAGPSIRPRLSPQPISKMTTVGIASSSAASAASQLRLAALPSFGTCSVIHMSVCVSSRRVIELPSDIPPFAIFVPLVLVDNWPDDVADDLEGALRGTPQGLRLLAHCDELHLRLAALGDGDGLAALGDLVDQGEAPRLEGGGVDLPVHAPVPM